MAGIVYSGTITTGIVLSDPATQGTATVTGSVSKVDGDAIFGTAAFPWTVINQGTIQNTGTTGHGIQLVQGGTVNNKLATALIEGYSQGVLIKGAPGSVTNMGTIDAIGTNSDGVNFTDGGRIVNGSAAVTTALIAGVLHGVVINGSAGTVSNFGTIAASGTRSTVVLGAGGTLSNGSGVSTAALISGPATGVYVNGGVGVVTNFGGIVGSTGVFLRGGGVVNNGLASSTTATITGTNGNAVLIAGETGTISNFGTINATGPSAAVSLVEGGRVTNGSAAVTSALITGAGTGVYITHASGTVTNFGTISDTSTLIGNGVSIQFGGTVTNKGTIQNASTSNSNVYLRGGGSVINAINGAIVGLISGAGTGISVRGGVGTVTNFGTIQSSASSGIYLNGGGSITNQAGGLIAGVTPGIYARGDAVSVVNFGTIKTTGSTNAIYLRGGGSIVNNAGGTIAGAAAGILIGRQGGVVANSGIISGTIGVLGTTSGSLTLTNSGTISSTLGTAGTAVRLGNSVSHSVLIVQSGSTFIGAVQGGGTGEIDFVPGGVANMANMFGFTTIGLGNGFSHSLTLTDANFAGISGTRITVLGGDSGNNVNASTVSAASLGKLIFIGGGAGTDVVKGGASSDLFEFAAGDLGGADIVAGNGGSDDTLLMTSSGAVNATGVTGVEIYQLADGGANSLSLANANFSGVSGGFIRVYGGNGGNTVDGSGVTTAGNQLVMYGGTGTDTFTGGAGNDVFVFTAAALSAADTVAGGAGNDLVLMTTSGLVKAGGVTGVETFALTSGGANTLTLTNANFAGVTGASIRVVGGDAGNTVTASVLSAANRIVYTAGAGADAVTGGAGNDIFFAAGNTTMTGGAGANRFTFADIGANGIADFGASASNALVLRDSGFNLGVNEGLGTASVQHLAAGVFVANATGTFTTTGQRFAYNTATGDLRYDRDGSGAGFTASSVAVLADHATLTAGGAGNLFFIA